MKEKSILAPQEYPSDKIPLIVATGFTTALLGDERTLREFIIGNHLKKELEAQGKSAILYLINDSYDPLNYRQLRVGINKNEKLLNQFAPYCGRPISEIPDPFDCHENYAQHFAQALLKRLQTLEIYPVLLDSYQAYQKGYYDRYIVATFERYDQIKEMLSLHFPNFSLKNLFRIQCPQCSCLDSTHIFKVKNSLIEFGCERCGRSDLRLSTEEVRGKLSWKLDCAARWNIYQIDLETFSKAHLAELGSCEISKFLSQELYGGKIPKIVSYGDVKLSGELSYQLLNILPPPLLKALFITLPSRDLSITKDYLKNFCRKFQVRPGLSYLDYVRKELPKQALDERNLNGRGDKLVSCPHLKVGTSIVETIDERSLIAYGNRFSSFFFGKEFKLSLPEAKIINSADRSTAALASEVIHQALLIRRNQPNQDCAQAIKSYLLANNPHPSVYRYLRQVFGQTEGPNLATLLAILPGDYLATIQIILKYYGDRDKESSNHSSSSKAIIRVTDEANEESALISERTKSWR